MMQMVPTLLILMKLSGPRSVTLNRYLQAVPLLMDLSV